MPESGRILTPLVRPTKGAHAVERGTPLLLDRHRKRHATDEHTVVKVPGGSKIGALPSWLNLLVLPFVGSDGPLASYQRTDGYGVKGGKVWIEVDFAGHPVLDRELVIVDLETTGLSPDLDEIIEIGAVLVRGDQVVDEFQTLVKPRRSIPAFITSFTGISNAMVQHSPPIEAALPALWAFVGDRPIVAHNAQFDLGFLRAAAARLRAPDLLNPTLCTLRIARQLLPDRPHGLGELANHYRIAITDRHRALGDARMTHILLQRLLRPG